MENVGVGDPAPEFSLQNQNGEACALKSVKDSYVVIFFYPKDDTSGCTLEAKGFTALAKKFKAAGACILGISGGDSKSKAKFCKKQDLEVTLLSDTDFAVAKSFAAYGPKKFMGKNYNGIFRMTFVLDKKKKIVKIYDKVKPETHAAEVLADLSKNFAV